MKKKTKLTLLVDEKLLAAYKAYCQREGIIISRQVEKMMERDIQKSG